MIKTVLLWTMQRLLTLFYWILIAIFVNHANKEVLIIITTVYNKNLNTFKQMKNS